FRDCLRDAVRTGDASRVITFWIQSVLDVCVSVPRERVVFGLAEAAHVIDSIVILGIIGFHLLVAGFGIAASVGGSMLLTAIAGTALGAFAVGISHAIRRFRKIHYRFI